MKATQTHHSSGHQAAVNQSDSNSAAPSFQDNREETQQLKELIGVMNDGTTQLRKDKALKDFGGKSSGQTSMKLINQKSGGQGVFQYPYQSGYVIDTFQGTNIATPPKGYSKGAITSYGTVDLTQKLTKSEIEEGGRPLHFREGDKALGISADSRANKATWHHLKTFGQMELIDMNVHGAMWHYGGIAKWGEHGGGNDGDDDEPSSE
ncbi:MAG: HNH endonuclease [bacterium]|nr:HNH endonuclease [bacterium]